MKLMVIKNKKYSQLRSKVRFAATTGQLLLKVTRDYFDCCY